MSDNAMAIAASDAETRELVLDLAQLCFDLAGIVDPTPISDGSSMLISLGRGRWFDAVISGASMIPYVGDLAKFGKLDRYVKTVEKAFAAARRSEKAAALLDPILVRLQRLVQLMPSQLPAPLAKLRADLNAYVRGSTTAAKIGKVLPDISRQFRFKPRWREGAFEFEELAGRLGVPGKVKTHRSTRAQSEISSGTGDHAGHRIGSQFGPPGDSSNLALQNANINTYAPRTLQGAFQGSGGSYLKMEKEWAEKLERGYGIDVIVRDRYRPGEVRPISRLVEWKETSPTGAVERRSLEYLNTTSPQSRAVGNR